MADKFMRGIESIFELDQRPLLIAEVALTHDGSLGLAHAFVDAVATTGVDAIKFQTHIAEAESSQFEAFRVKFSYVDATRYDYWRRTAFTLEHWAGLKTHAEEKGLIFLSSPFSTEAVDLLNRLGMVAWKVGSGEIHSPRMLDRMARTGRPLLVSTGMSGYADVDDLVQRLEKLCPRRHAVLQCTTEYPTPATAVGLNVLQEYQRRYRCPIGLSDHSGTMFPALTATWLGARVIEVHVVLSRQMFGPDVSSSLTVDELREMVRGIDFVQAMRAHPVDKDAMAAMKAPLRRLFGKSAAAARELAAGHVITEQDVCFRKPGQGITETEFDRFLGKKLKRPLVSGAFFDEGDFE